ncbi:DUF742 domain-containing protein [Streptomyces echinoruber]|uniref:DUF742 domain-containing protein n=1 Tax=Streptomyces echinoruber TaxID=68898 RepID=A0A918V7R7_9ACTN|nr:DUF742 domain-containing protein [Streptomyces echinoruber]GGZ73454.1 hypothetical protein GCM10010389_08830 [Streptomyces echinoruber]
MRPHSGPKPLSAGASVEVADFVRTYTLTGGRTRPRHRLRLETVLELGPGRPGPALPLECEQILVLCRIRRRSVAELAGTLGRPVSAVRILVSDLLDTRALRVPVPAADSAYIPSSDPAAGNDPSVKLLEAVLAGLKTRFPDAYPQAG